MERQNCYNCRFLLRFTPMEAEGYSAKLAGLGLGGDFFGGCTKRYRSRPFVIHRYLDQLVSDCRHWQEGYFQDPVGTFCPQCQEGRVVVVRPAKNKQTYALIGCSRHPNCNFSTRYLPLKTRCRFCGVPLVLGAGDQLAVSCPLCKRRVVVPLTLASWPQLFVTGDSCVHGRPWAECEICSLSRSERRNLVDLELPAVAEYWLKLQRPHLAEELAEIISWELEEEEGLWDFDDSSWAEELTWWWKESRIEEEEWWRESRIPKESWFWES